MYTFINVFIYNIFYIYCFAFYLQIIVKKLDSDNLFYSYASQLKYYYVSFRYI